MNLVSTAAECSPRSGQNQAKSCSLGCGPARPRNADFYFKRWALAQSGRAPKFWAATVVSIDTKRLYSVLRTRLQVSGKKNEKTP